MRPTPDKVLSTFIRLDGCRVNAFLTTPQVIASNTLMPVRSLHVPKPCLVSNGDVLRQPGGGMILLMEAPQDSETNTVFRASFINQSYAWTRNTQILDPVAKVQRDTGKVSMGVLYVYFEKPIDQGVGQMNDTRYQFYTGQDVRVGDSVGSKLVKRVVNTVGVRFVYVE